jgi:glycerophosphoryl diester phosphodiesterase
MQVVAHRGALREALENSWTAYDLALNHGSKGIEVDARLSKDGHVFLMHDDSLLKSAGLQQNLSRLSAQEIRKIRLQNGEPIPDLSHFLERYVGKMTLYIELKTPGPEVAERVAQAISPFQHQGVIELSSFEYEHLRHLKDHHPHIPRGFIWGPHEGRRLPVHYASPPFAMEAFQCQTFWPQYNAISEEWLEISYKKSWRIIPWVPAAVDDHQLQLKEDLWKKLKDWNLFGLCTNRCKELAQWVTNY